jgi:hypothetical protein
MSVKVVKSGAPAAFKKSKFWDAEIDGVLEESPDILMQDGEWYLYDFNEEEDTVETSSMWHRCPKDRDNLTGTARAPWGSKEGESMWPVRWMDWHITPAMTTEFLPHGWKCAYCYEKPCDKILTLFLLHNFDRLAK